jgi:hypothetical protein
MKVEPWEMQIDRGKPNNLEKILVHENGETNF